MKKIILVCLLFSMMGMESYAQDPEITSSSSSKVVVARPTHVRVDDHFWRRKVVNRIDLTEKINFPLIKREHNFYDDESQYNSQYTEKKGLIVALFNGLKQGKYVAYKSDSINVSLGYDGVMELIQEINGSVGADDLWGDTEEDGGFDDFGGEEDEGDDWGFGDSGDDEGDDWGFGDDGGDDEFGTLEEEGDDLGEPEVPVEEFDPEPFENVIHFVEDRIFDKTRSDMVYDIQLLEIIWTDPAGILPEKSLCVFRYNEVLETLENAQWKNRFNDAQYKTLREIFELRLFHSYIMNVSGVGVIDLNESEQRRQQLVEFEHHLWSY